MGSVHEFYRLKALITLEQVNILVIKKRRILMSKTSMVSLTSLVLQIFIRCKRVLW